MKASESAGLHSLEKLLKQSTLLSNIAPLAQCSLASYERATGRARVFYQNCETVT